MGLLGMAARTAVVAGTATHVAGNVQRRQQRRWAEKDAAQQPPPQYEEQQPPAQQQYAAPPPPPPPPPPAAEAAPAGGGDLVAQLKQLGELHTQGAITDEEFTAAKAKLLGG
jgi:putative oligomerization/nucleic acid binding protein